MLIAGGMLSENSQLTACKYLGALIADFINSFGELGFKVIKIF